MVKNGEHFLWLFWQNERKIHHFSPFFTIGPAPHARTHADGRKATMYKKKPRSLTLVLDSFVPSARVMDREKITYIKHVA